MVKFVGIDEAVQRLRDGVDGFAGDYPLMVVDESGEVKAAIIGPEEYARLARRFGDELRVLLDEIGRRTAHVDPAEIELEITAVVGDVRQERSAQQHAAAAHHA